MADEKRNLYQRWLDVMNEVGTVEKTGTATIGGRYNFHKIDDIEDRLGPALVKHGIIATLSKLTDRKMEHETEQVEQWENGKKKVKNRTTWSADVEVEITLINADDPKERETIVGWGQGLDFGDKATGKAISYALKTAYLAAFHLRGQPDNEDHNIHRPKVTPPADFWARPNAQIVKAMKEKLAEKTHVGECLNTIGVLQQAIDSGKIDGDQYSELNQLVKDRIVEMLPQDPSKVEAMDQVFQKAHEEGKLTPEDLMDLQTQLGKIESDSPEKLTGADMAKESISQEMENQENESQD